MKKTLWMLLDDRRGSVGQARGIAEILNDKLNIVEKQLVYNSLASWPNWIKGRSLFGINTKESDKIEAPYPELVLSTSRRTVATARYIRKKSGNKTKIIQLMYPSGGVGIKDMELVIVPAHDSKEKRENKKSFVITGAPTRIFAEKVAEWKKQWDPIFSNLPKPWISVIIGGAIKGKPWPLDNARELADKLKEIHNQLGGSLLITSSRRTGKEAENIIMNTLQGIPMYTYMWGEKKENPIMGFYSCADLIIATADSVSMCSEACGTGNPVLLFRGHDWLTTKHQNFAQSLIDHGFAGDINDKDATKFKPISTLNPTYQIADKILEIS